MFLAHAKHIPHRVRALPQSTRLVRSRILAARAGALALAITFGWSCSGATNLQWTQGAGVRSAPFSIPSQGKAGFTLLPPSATGINFTNLLTDEQTRSEE